MLKQDKQVYEEKYFIKEVSITRTAYFKIPITTRQQGRPAQYASSMSLLQGKG